MLKWLTNAISWLRHREARQDIERVIQGDSTRLDLSYRFLSTLPPEIAQLQNLSALYLSDNQLSMLPPEITQLQNLTRLELSDNQLSTLPPEIIKLQHLTDLDLGRNQLSTLPSEITKLPNLTELDLSGNQLSTLPPEIIKLQKLTRLNLRDNQLSTLPPEIAKLSNLTELDLNGNPLTDFPPEIVEQGTEAILEYLREQTEDGTPEWISKLLVVGEGGVGKTSLLRALRHEDFNPQENTTHGIEIRQLPLPHPKWTGVTMQLNTWDFGGQEIYHATHQFFLSNRSLFLLVWNARHGFEQGRLYYWLDTIQAKAPESPVLIVATHIDQRDADMPLGELRRKYPQILAHYEVSSSTSLGIETLRQVMIDVAANLPLMGEKWPTAWRNAAYAIRDCQEHYITPAAMYEMITAHRVRNEHATILAQWLHDLGDILYFQNDPDLNDIVILQPQWVTQYISKVLTSEEVIQRLGVFTRQHMKALWSDIDAAIQDHFLRLMEKFDLSYRILENRDQALEEF